MSLTSEKKPLIMTDPSKGVKMNASVVAQSFRDTIKQKVEAMKNDGIGEFYKTSFYIAIYSRIHGTCMEVWQTQIVQSSGRINPSRLLSLPSFLTHAQHTSTCFLYVVR